MLIDEHYLIYFFSQHNIHLKTHIYQEEYVIQVLM